MKLDKELLDRLLDEASANPRRRQNLDLRTSVSDTSQRMLNAILPGSVVPVHRHSLTSETVVCLRGRLDEVFYVEDTVYESSDAAFPRGMDARDVTKKTVLRELRRVSLCPSEGCFGCQIPKGMWHTVEVYEPSVILEAKDGAYMPCCPDDVFNDKEVY